MKCETPPSAGSSSREPAPTQKPIATERTPSSRSLTTRTPPGASSDTSWSCTAGTLRRRGTGGDRHPRSANLLLAAGALRSPAAAAARAVAPGAAVAPAVAVAVAPARLPAAALAGVRELLAVARAERLGGELAPVLALRHELEGDAAPLGVDLGDLDVDRVALREHLLDLVDAHP